MASIIAALSGMVGLYLSGRLAISGWLFWMMSSSLWLIIGWHYSNYGMMLQSFVSCGLNVVGLVTWRKSLAIKEE